MKISKPSRDALLAPCDENLAERTENAGEELEEMGIAPGTCMASVNMCEVCVLGLFILAVALATIAIIL